jgi:PAS domain S-box-containing protein
MNVLYCVTEFEERDLKAQKQTRNPNKRRKSLGSTPSAQESKSAKKTAQRKRSQTPVHERPYFLQKILDTEPGVVYIYDLEESRNVYINRHWLVAFGYTEDETQEMMDNLFVRIGHPDDLAGIFAHHEQWRQANEDDLREIEYRLRTKAGEWRWLHSREATFMLNEEGKVKQILGIAHDITTRKQTEDALRESEARFRAMADFSPIGIFLTAPDGFSLYANGQNLRQMGLTKEEAKGIGWQQAIHPEDRADVFSRFADAVQHGSVYEGINRYLHADGTVVWVDVNAVPIRDGERLVGYAGTVADITERMQVEEKLHRHINYLTALREVDQAIVASFDVHISLSTLISQAVTLLGVDAATILLIDPLTNSLHSAVAYGFRTRAVHTAYVRLGESYAGRAAVERQMLQIPNLANDPHNLFLTGFLKGEDFVSYCGVPLIVKGEAIGVLEVFQRKLIDRNEEWFEFLNSLAGQAAIAIEHAKLLENLKSSNRRLSQAYDATIEGWSRAMDLRDKETEGHTQRVTDMTMRLALAMNIDETDIVHIRRGALLHDIGKLGIPDHILLKADALTDEEWLIMRQHPGYAFNMLASVDYLHHALEIPYSHHEKWDGSGYPRGLKALEIPLAARIFAVADVWDAITSDRPYRKGWSKADALKYIQEQSGTDFDPHVVNVFLKIIDESVPD